VYVHASLHVRICVCDAIICAFDRVLRVVTCRHIFMMLFRVSYRHYVYSKEGETFAFFLGEQC